MRIYVYIYLHFICSQYIYLYEIRYYYSELMNQFIKIGNVHKLYILQSNYSKLLNDKGHKLMADSQRYYSIAIAISEY